MASPSEKKMAIIDVLERTGSAKPTVHFKNVLNYLRIDEDEYNIKSFYRHLNELEDEGKLVTEFYDKANQRIAHPESTSGLNKIIFHPNAQRSVVGHNVIKTYGGDASVSSLIKNGVSFHDGELEVESEGEVLLYFSVNNFFTCLRLSSEYFPINVMISRLKKGEESPPFSELEGHFGRRLVWLQLPIPGISSYKGTKDSGHIHINIKSKNEIKLEDLNSQNGVKFSTLSKAESDEFIKRGDAAGVNTLKSDEAPSYVKKSLKKVTQEEIHEIPALIELSSDFKFIISD